jgi:hypothetical protein
MTESNAATHNKKKSPWALLLAWPSMGVRIASTEKFDLPSPQTSVGEACLYGPAVRASIYPAVGASNTHIAFRPGPYVPVSFSAGYSVFLLSYLVFCLVLWVSAWFFGFLKNIQTFEI